MKKLSIVLAICSLFALKSCKISSDEEPFYTTNKPMNKIEQVFALKGFDKIEMGSAFIVNIKEGTTYEVKATGDSVDIADLLYSLQNNTLLFKYVRTRPHREGMQIDITLPILRAATLGEAASGSIECADKSDELLLNLKEASHFNLKGIISKIQASVIEASYLNTYDATNKETILNVEGASQVKVRAEQRLEITAKGVSKVWYRGNATTVINKFDLSQVIKD